MSRNSQSSKQSLELVFFIFIRLWIYSIVFVIICLTAVLPWSIFQFHKFYETVIAPHHSKIIIPVSFSYEYLHQPPFAVLDLAQLKLSQLVSAGGHYDFTLKFHGYCPRSSPKAAAPPYSFASSSNSDLLSDAVDVSGTNGYQEYAVKMSMIAQNDAIQLLNQYHTANNYHYFIKKNPSRDTALLQPTNFRSRNSWPVSSYLFLLPPAKEKHELYASKANNCKHQDHISFIQSFLLNCNHQVYENRLIPPILKYLLPPFIYEFGLPKLSSSASVPSFMASSALNSIVSNSYISIRLLSNFKMNSGELCRFTNSHLFIEFNQRVLINNLDAVLELQLVHRSWNLFAFLENHSIIVHIVGSALLFFFNMFTFFLGCIIIYYFLNKQIYTNKVAPQLLNLVSLLANTPVDIGPSQKADSQYTITIEDGRIGNNEASTPSTQASDTDKI